jgi:hypothetical protein
MYNFRGFNALYTENDLILQFNKDPMSVLESFCHFSKIKMKQARVK